MASTSLTAAPAAAAAEHHHLRDNQFSTRVLSSFREYRHQFQDIALACDDGNGGLIRVHRIVLSASSALLANMFATVEDNGCFGGNDVVYLRGVSMAQLVPLVDFMYTGELEIPETELAALLAAAETLQVAGLLGAKDAGDAGPSSSFAGGKGGKRKNSAAAIAEINKRKKQKVKKEEEEEEDDHEEEDTKEDREEDSAGPSTSGGGGSKVGLHAKYAGVIRLPTGHGQCLLCGKILSNPAKARRHQRLTHGEGEEIECHICSSKFRHMDSLNNHLRGKHNIYQSYLPKKEPLP